MPSMKFSWHSSDGECNDCGKNHFCKYLEAMSSLKMPTDQYSIKFKCHGYRKGD